MSTGLNTDEFLGIASRLEGRRLTTPARGAGFTVTALPNGIEVVPASTSRARKVPASRIAQFLEEYNNTGIHQPGHYQDITFDASYLLAILSHAEAEED